MSGRIEAAGETGLTPLVGRERDLDDPGGRLRERALRPRPGGLPGGRGRYREVSAPARLPPAPDGFAPLLVRRPLRILRHQQPLPSGDRRPAPGLPDRGPRRRRGGKGRGQHRDPRRRHGLDGALPASTPLTSDGRRAGRSACRPASGAARRSGPCAPSSTGQRIWARWSSSSRICTGSMRPREEFLTFLADSIAGIRRSSSSPTGRATGTPSVIAATTCDSPSSRCRKRT